MDELTILTMNVQGFKDFKKRKKVLHWASKKKFDVFLTQETHFESKDKDEWESSWDGVIINSAGEIKNKNISKGVSIFIRDGLDHEILEKHIDKYGRYIILFMRIRNHHCTVVNYYGPNKDSPDTLSTMLNIIDEIECNNVIFGGDFNFVFNPEIDKLGGTSNTNYKCRDTLLSWMDDRKYLDIWRVKNPKCNQFTWRSNRVPRVYCRLDFFVVSCNIAGSTSFCEIKPGLCSDHSCVLLKVSLDPNTRGRGFWKFNNSLLDDPLFCTELENTIGNTAIDNKGTEEQLFWETLKCTMRGCCIAYSIKRKKQNKCKMEALNGEIEELEKSLPLVEGLRVVSQANADTIKAMEINLKLKKDELDKLIENDASGAALRSKCKFYEDGDKATKFFLNIEKKQAENKSIKRLINDSGKEITNLEDILEEERRYYLKLYSSTRKNVYEPLVENTMYKDMQTLESEKVPGEMHEMLTAPITDEELWDIIKESPNGKSPGADGYTNEFYKKFWPKLKLYVTASLRKALSVGSLSISQRQGVINLIPKANKDPVYLKNWRPITLLNQDYKYLAKCLAHRCKDILPNIISPDQTGFVPGRLIGTNILRIFNLMNHCSVEKINAMLVCIDFEKAFDSIEWDFMLGALKFFNFPELFIKWIHTFYNDIDSRVINNGNISSGFKPSRGVRQGCPLSPMLFVISIELLSLYMKRKSNLEGVMGKSGNYLISQFADDTSFALTGSKASLVKLFDILQTFTITSGLKVNVDKTEIMLMGQDHNVDLGKFNSLVKEKVKILGVDVCKSRKETVDANFPPILEKIKGVLNLWCRRKLSLAGKITIIKSLAASKLIYCLTVLPSPPKPFWEELNRLLFRFISNNKPEKHKRVTLIGPYDQGGFQMVDLELQNQALKMSWMDKIMNLNGIWRDFVVEQNTKIDFRYLIQCNVKYCDLPLKFDKNNIWGEIWIHWCSFNYKKELTNALEVTSQNLWFNSNLLINGKVCHFQRWNERGITMFHHLLEESTYRLLNYTEFCDKFQFYPPFTEFYGLMGCIPKSWKTLLIQATINEDDEDELKLIDRLELAEKPSKYFYDELVKTKFVPPLDKSLKWQEECDEMWSEEDWLKSFSDVRVISQNNKLRSFRYNLLIRNVSYNKKLYYMKLTESPNCPSCKDEIESLKHLYWDCPNSTKMWRGLRHLWEYSYGPTTELTFKECILGIFTEGDAPNTRNCNIFKLLCSLTSQYININKCLGIPTTIEGLICKFVDTYKIERKLAAKNHVNFFHEKKWGRIGLTLNPLLN